MSATTSARRPGPRPGVLAALLRHEARLTWRYGIVAAAAFVAATWIGVLSRLSAEVRADVLPYVVMLDVGIIGLYFVGGLVLFEQGERTIAAMATAPVRPLVALVARVTALTAVALAATAAITLAAGVPVDAVVLTSGVVAMSVQCTLAGAAAVAPFRSITDYVAAAPLPLLPFSVPVVLAAVGIEHPALVLLPVAGSVALVEGAFTGISVASATASLATSAAWSAVLAVAVVALHERLLRRRI